MPRKLPPFVERWRDRHGKVRVYFRKDRGTRLPLPDTIGSDEFNDAYQAALLGQPASLRDRFARAAPGTIAALVASYMKSGEYIGLRETTKMSYASPIEVLRAQHGHRTVAGLSRERIITGILQPYADRPGAALLILKILRVIIRHAINIGWLKHDPSLGIKRPKIQRIRAWTEDEIETYRMRWPLGTKQRLAFELFLNVGQRRSDVVRMAWSHITADNKIVVVQQKTGRRLLIPASSRPAHGVSNSKAHSRLDPNDNVWQAVHRRRLQSVDARCDHECRPSARLSAPRPAEDDRPPPRRGRRDREDDHVDTWPHHACRGRALH
jgi:integrase